MFRSLLEAIFGRYKGWVVGPIVNGRSYSRGLVERPRPIGSGFSLTLPDGSELDGVTKRSGPLNHFIHARYRVSYPYGGSLEPSEFPERGPAVSLFFQRKGDNWSGSENAFEFYRWYSATVFPMTEGEHEVMLELDPSNWTSVLGKQAAAEFVLAKANIDNVGLVFGTDFRRGHGLLARGMVVFDLISFEAA